MKFENKTWLFGGGLAILFAVLLVYVGLNSTGRTLQLVIVALITLSGLVILIGKNSKDKADASSGDPAADEFTKMVKVYAGNRAFLYSMYLWMLIFFFHDSFSKAEEMLGIGILGSALIYRLSLWYYTTTAAFDAD